MMIVGDIIGDLPFTVNYSVVGGVPNDALVPTANESLPDKGPFRTVFGLTHQEILNDGQDVVQGVDHITGRS
jgi:hypothetical protein